MVLTRWPPAQNARVAGEHAVDVGPDLDLFGADAGADDGGGEVGAAAAERGGDAVFGGADEAAHDDDCSARPAAESSRPGAHRCRRYNGAAWVWRRSVTITSRESTCTAGMPRCWNACVTIEARQSFAEAEMASIERGVSSPRTAKPLTRSSRSWKCSQINCSNASCPRAGSVDGRARRGTVRKSRASSQSLGRDDLSPPRRRWRAACSSFCPSRTRPRRAGAPGALGHDGDDAVDGVGGFDGRAAELHHDHQSSIPSECISSRVEYRGTGSAADGVVAAGDELPVEDGTRREDGRRRRPCRSRARRRGAAAGGPAVPCR